MEREGQVACQDSILGGRVTLLVPDMRLKLRFTACPGGRALGWRNRTLLPSSQVDGVLPLR